MSGERKKLTPAEMTKAADQMVTSLLGLDMVTRTSMLIQLRQQNDAMHALVIARMKHLRRQAGGS